MCNEPIARHLRLHRCSREPCDWADAGWLANSANMLSLLTMRDTLHLAWCCALATHRAASKFWAQNVARHRTHPFSVCFQSTHNQACLGRIHQPGPKRHPEQPQELEPVRLLQCAGELWRSSRDATITGANRSMICCKGTKSTSSSQTHKVAKLKTHDVVKQVWWTWLSLIGVSFTGALLTTASQRTSFQLWCSWVFLCLALGSCQSSSQLWRAQRHERPVDIPIDRLSWPHRLQDLYDCDINLIAYKTVSLEWRVDSFTEDNPVRPCPFFPSRASHLRMQPFQAQLGTNLCVKAQACEFNSTVVHESINPYHERAVTILARFEIKLTSNGLSTYEIWLWRNNLMLPIK